MAWWLSPVLGSQPRTRYLSASWTIARKRSSLRRGSCSPQPSMVSRSVLTWAPTLPSGWPERGSPQARPSARVESSASRRSSSLSGSKAATGAADLVESLGDPALVATSQGDAYLVAAADRYELAPVLADPGAIVHQAQVEPLDLPAGAGIAHRLADGLFEERAIPSPVGRPGLLERAIGGRNAVLEPRLLGTGAAAHGHEAADQDEQDHDRGGDQDNGEDGHGTGQSRPPGMKRAPSRGALERTGGDLLSQGRVSQVPSALRGLTALFGMGRGVAPSLSPPKYGETGPSPALENRTVGRRAEARPEKNQKTRQALEALVPVC